jgi:hypothetical protein
MGKPRNYDHCDGCDRASSDCWKDRPQCRLDIERCDGCGAGILLDDLDGENIISKSQAHPYGSTVAYEIYTVGFICPICDCVNKF